MISTVVIAGWSGSLAAKDLYVEPGSLRLSHSLTLEGVMHRLQPGWRMLDDGLSKSYSVQGDDDRPWKTEWGQSLLTEVAARVTPNLFGRVLFEGQGEYADRFWRPININHDIDQKDRNFFFRQAEARIDKDNWYAHGFSGVGHAGWRDKGDFFGLYPESYPDDDYLGIPGYFGVYPENWKQDKYLNLSRRHVPEGVEAGANALGWDGAVAYGDELSWGFSKSIYGRLSAPLRSTKLTFVYKDEDVPYAAAGEDDDRNQAYELAWHVPSEAGHRFDAAVLYNPYRVGDPYLVAREADGGSGLLGSSVDISRKTTSDSDAFAERLRLERHDLWGSRVWIWAVDLTHADILAGNKDQIDLELGTDVTPSIKGNVQYTFRKPVEGPIPFLFEGTPDNVGAVAANPRGPESPFWVNWQNREAVFVVTTLSYDPTPGSTLFNYDPRTLANWNINPNEDAPFAVAVQHRMSDYRTTTDRQYYYTLSGDIVWEPAAHTGAWPSDGFLHEFRLMALGKVRAWKWTAGVAGGQSPALLGLAYSNDTSHHKPLTEYISLEARLELWPWAWWGHFGSGVWGPESSFHPHFGESFDRLWGLGTSYNIAANTTVDLNYLVARQDDSLFVAPDLGSYDEIRMLFSHRFGFLFQFQEAARAGYRAQ